MMDFFISYNSADRQWAEWIAWQLEGAGYTTIIQAWDFLPGQNFVGWMQLATTVAERTVAVLSKSYLAAKFTHPEWAAAFAKDPTGEKGTLLPVRVRDCDLTGLLNQIVYIDLIGLTEEQAKGALLERVRPLFDGAPPRTEPVKSANRTKPLIPPSFPLSAPLSVEVPNNLPHRHDKFIGREREISAIRQRLMEAPLLTLTGAGGVGKSRLAEQIAGTLLDEYPDGVWLVKLGPLEDPVLVPQAVASVQGLPEEPNRPLMNTLKDYLQTKHQLLILDNCEHLKAACADLAERLLNDCPYLRIIATSREPLGHLWEYLWPVPPLTPPDPKDLPPLDELKQNEAISLFEDRARKKQPKFRLTSNNSSAVAQICHRVSGVPYAIELAAARIRDLVTAENINDQLAASGILSLLRVEAVIEWSYNSLPEQGQTLFNRLSVFAGGWTLAAPQEVCADKDLRSKQFPGLHTQLVNKSLVFGESFKGEARYRLLQIGQEYGEERLRASGEETVIRDRHAEYYLKIAETSEQELISSDQGIWLERLDRDYNNLRTALAWIQGRPAMAEAGLRMAGALPQFWLIRGYLSEGRSILEELLGMDTGVSLSVRAKAIYAAGWLAWGQWEHKRAAAFYEESLSLYREVGDVKGIAWSLHDLGTVARDQGELPRAKELLEQGLKLFREAGDERGVAWTLHNLGLVARMEGEYARATELYKASLASFRKRADVWGIAWSLHDLGLVATDQGEFQRAASLYEESEVLFQKLGDRRGIAWSRYIMGAVERFRGNYQRATSLYEESRLLFQKMSDRRGIAWSLHKLGNLARDQGDCERANALLNRSLTTFEELDDQRGIAWTKLNLGMVAGLQSNYKKAVSLYEECIAVFKKRSDALGVSRAAHELANVAKEVGDYQRAKVYYEESLALFRKLGYKCDVAWVLHDLGSIATYQSDYEQAKKCLNASLEEFKKLDDRRGVAYTLQGLGKVARFRNEYDQARLFFEESLSITRGLDDKRGLAWLLHELGGLAKYQGDFERAKAVYEESLELFRSFNDRRAIAWTSRNLGSVARLENDYKRAVTFCEESLAIFRELSEKRGIAASLYDLGNVAKEQGDYRRAKDYLRESVSLFDQLGDKRGAASALQDLAIVTKEQGDYARSAHLLGAAEQLRGATGGASAAEQVTYGRCLVVLQTELGPADFAAAWSEGQAMSIDGLLAG